MAFDCPGAYQYSFNADVNLSSPGTDQFIAVAVGPSQNNTKGEGQGNTCLLAYASGQTFIGILQSCPKQGDAATVMLRGISRCVAAGTWTAGQGLKVVDKGYLAAASSGDTVFAIALESAVAGDTSSCLIR